MTKRTFEIEWPDDYGTMWMNVDNLLVCLTEKCRNTTFKVTDITGDGEPALPEILGPVNPQRDARDMKAILEAVARGWCSDRNSYKIMDTDLAEDIAQEVFEALNK